MQSRPTSIDRGAWERAWADVQAAPIPDPNADAMTTADLELLWGVARTQATRRARQLVQAGKAQAVPKLVRRADGGVIKVPAYRLVSA